MCDNSTQISVQNAEERWYLVPTVCATVVGLGRLVSSCLLSVQPWHTTSPPHSSSTLSNPKSTSTPSLLTPPPPYSWQPPHHSLLLHHPPPFSEATAKTKPEISLHAYTHSQTKNLGTASHNFIALSCYDCVLRWRCSSRSLLRFFSQQVATVCTRIAPCRRSPQVLR